MAECFFCGNDETLTKAHLFQKGFREMFEKHEGKVSLASSSISTPGVSRDVVFKGDVGQTNVVSLCGDCNNNWMNQIEQAAAPAFKSIMQNKGFPKPADLFKLAHWAVVLSALSSEVTSHIEVPVSHRRTIRFTRTGQPENYSTHFIWTNDYFQSLESSFIRSVYEESSDDDAVQWFHVLYAGPLVAISATPDFGPRIARVLEENGINSVLGTFSSNLVYTPRGLREVALTGKGMPTHEKIRQILPTVLNADIGYIRTTGSEVLDLSGGINFNKVDLSFDFTDLLQDKKDELDLTYLDGLFPKCDCDACQAPAVQSPSRVL